MTFVFRQGWKQHLNWDNHIPVCFSHSKAEPSALTLSQTPPGPLQTDKTLLKLKETLRHLCNRPISQGRGIKGQGKLREMQNINLKPTVNKTPNKLEAEVKKAEGGKAMFNGHLSSPFI